MVRYLLLFTFLFTHLLLFAGHRPGGSYTWRCIGPNTYEISFNAITDCAHGLDNTTKYCLTGSLAGDPNNGAYTIPLVNSSNYVTAYTVPFCSNVNDCQGGGNYNWVTQVVYIDTIVLASPISPSYKIYFCDGGGRPNASTHGGSNFYNEATFYTVNPCNSAAYATNFHDVIYCVGQQACIINNYVDPDGDSLAFSLVDCKKNSTQPVNYNVPFSGVNPLSSSTGFQIDSLGNICFTATTIQKGPVCLQVSEYRNGILVGVQVDDVFINVIDCQYAFVGPTATIAGTNVSCFGGSNGSATVAASGGGTPYTYLWSPSGGTNATATGLSAGTYTVTVTGSGGCDTTASYTVTQPASPVTVAVGSTNVSCNGANNGTASATPSGGIPGYTYLWSPSGGTGQMATNLGPGTYTVTVKDTNLCQATASVTITQPATLSASISSVTHVSCFGGSNGSASVSVSGGTSPYSYSWSSGHTTATASGLTAGNYTVIITDANGCTATVSVTINQPAALSLSTSVINVSCYNGADGSASVSVSGGAGSYTYNWFPTLSTNSTISNLSAGNYSVTVTDANGCQATASVTITQPTVVMASATIINHVSCFGGSNGSASVSASGGSPSYTYQWSPTGGTSTVASNLPSGNYTVTVTDSKGCTGTASVNINQPSAVAVTITKTNVSCNGGSNGSAIAIPSGGTAPYTYFWSPVGGTGATATNLSTGTYSVLVTDSNGCSVTQSITITQPPLLTASIAQTNVLCNGGNNGSATLLPSGGTSTYSFSWSTIPVQNTVTATGLSQGTYTGIITDSKGCTASASVTITEPSAIALSTSQTNVSCYGGSNGSATVNVTGGITSYSYNWSPSGGTNATAVNLQAGTYTVTVTDNNNCTANTSVTITQPTVLTAAASVVSHVSCNGGSNGSVTVNTNGGTPGYSYLWSSGHLTATVSGLAAGTYSVTVTDVNGCQATSGVTVNQPAGMTLTTSSVNATCNAANGQASVAVSGGTPSYTYSWNTTPIQTSSIATGIPAGTYTVTVIDGAGCSASANVIVNNTSGPTATISSSSNVSCNGGNDGSATVTATGSVPPFTYNWSPGGATTATASNLSAGVHTVTVTDGNGCSNSVSVTLTEPAALFATTTQTNVSCFGGNNGSATVTVSGGVSSYSYNWSPTGGNNATAASLPAGNYTVTIIDNNGCMLTQSVTITQPVSLSSSVTVNSNVSCFGGSNGNATASASGGISGYTFTWSNGATGTNVNNLPAGSHSVIVTDQNGCQSTSNFTITQPGSISYFTSQTNVSCNGGNDGSGTVIATSGTSPYSYYWSPVGVSGFSASGLSAGAYSVLITDANQCQATATVTITQPAVLTANILSVNHVSCSGGSNGSATVSPSGGTSSYTYLWSSGHTTATASGLTAGNYTITVTDVNSCTASSSVSINQPSVLSLSTSAVNVSCFNGSDGSASVNVSGGVAGYTYNWSPISGTNSSISNLPAGNYSVTVTDANGCQATALVVVTQPTVLTASASVVNNVSCFGGSNGSASVSVSGGSPGYSYQWAPSGGTGVVAANLQAGTYTVTVTDNKGCTTFASVNVSQPTTVNVSTTQTNVSCFGGNNGTATASPSGGVSPYTYFWSPSGGSAATANNLPAGSYTVTVTDANGCSASGSLTITQPTALSASASIINVSCNGGNNGSATLAGSGGTGIYSYSWNTTPVQNTATASNIAAGTYTGTITDNNGCTANTSVTVTQPLALSLTTSQTNVSCNGGNNGSASVNAMGGVSPYTYNWTPTGGNNATANNLPPGIYTVNVTDNNGCAASASVTITEPPPLTATALVLNHASCNGEDDGEVTVSFSGGTPGYQIIWSNGEDDPTIYDLTAGTYTVIITDYNGCSVQSSVTVNEPLALQITAANATVVSCFGGNDGSASITVSGGTSPYNYNWTPGSYTSASVTGLVAGNYTVTVTDTNNCGTSTSITITEPSAIIGLLVSSSDVTCFSSCNGSAQVSASGGTGPYVYSWSPGGQSSAAVNNLCAGTHTVTITDNKGCQTNVQTVITEPAALSTVISKTDASCAGVCDGTSVVVTSGGTGPYSFLWNPGFQTTPNVTGLCAGSYSVSITDANGCTSANSIIINEPTGFTITTSSVASNCGASTGSACVSVSGGTNPITYQWNDPNLQTSACAINVPAAAYTVIITDGNGCTDQAVVNVNDVGGPVVTITGSTNVSCSGGANGTATASITGGTSPYSILWSNGTPNTTFVANLTAGTHSITVTDNAGCVSSASVIVTEPSALNSGITSVTNPTCNLSCNGQATVSAGGGTSPYTYSWNDPNLQTSSTATALCTGNYSVTITDANGCTTSSLVTLASPPLLNATVVSVTNVSCNGGSNGSAQINVTGGTPGYTYSWTPNVGSGPVVNGLAAGNYSVLITDVNNCTANTSLVVTEPAPLAITTSVTNVSCFGGNSGSAIATVTGGSSPYNYSWSNGQITAAATGLAAGSYSVTVTDSNSCSSTSQVVITQPTALFAFISSQTNVSCNGGNNGSASVSGSGGVPPYTYLWSNGQTNQTNNNLIAGFYSVILTDANGCTDSASITVTEPNIISLATTQTNVSCNGGSNGTATVTASGGTPGYSYNWVPTGFNGQSPTGLIAGNYQVTVTDISGCSSVANITISEPPVLVGTVVSVTPVTCNGGNNGSATISASGGTPSYFYNWSPYGGSAASASSLTAGTYTVTITDSKGCQATVSANVSQPQGLTVSLNATNISCYGASNGSIAATASGGTLPYSYAWAPSGSTSTISGLGPGSYTLTTTDSNNCSLSVTTTISEPPVLNLLLSGSTNSTCNGACNGTASVAATGGTGSYTYLWSPGGQVSSSVNNLCAGSHTVTVADANGCTDTVNLMITQPSVITASITKTDVTCAGLCNGSANVSAAGGTGPYQFLWAGGQTSASISSLCQGNYTVTITDANNCSVTQSINITEPSPIVLNVATTIATCGNNNGTACITITGGTSPFIQQWNDPLLQTASCATGLAPNIYTVVVTDANGCSSSLNVPVSFSSPVVIDSITATPTICNGTPTGSATAYASNGSLPYSFLWNDINSQITPTASSLSGGSYTVLVTDSAGCTVSANVTVTQPNAVATSISSSDTVLCYGQNAQLFGTASGGTAPYQYFWSTGGTGPGPISINPLTTTAYTIYVQDINGCQSSTVAHTILVRPPISVTASDVTVCDGDSALIAATAIGGNDGPYSFDWSNGVSGSSQSVLVGISQSPATFIVTVNDGCSQSQYDTIKVFVNPNPFGNVTVLPDSTGCAPFNIRLTATGLPGTTYIWNFNDNTAPLNGSIVSHTYIDAGVYYPIVTASLNGCTTIKPALNNISVNPSPTAAFEMSPSHLTLDNSTVTFTNQTTNASVFQWNFGDGFYSTEEHPKHYYAVLDFYEIILVANNEFGCTDTAKLRATSEYSVVFPTAFTPDPSGANGGVYSITDLSNNTFYPFTSGVDEYHLMIFNRWGELIFESFELEKGWDGYYREKLCQQDTYIWKAFIKFNNGQSYKNLGPVTLFR